MHVKNAAGSWAHAGGDERYFSRFGAHVKGVHVKGEITRIHILCRVWTALTIDDAERIHGRDLHPILDGYQFTT